jgi:hypothetical protein
MNNMHLAFLIFVYGTAFANRLVLKALLLTSSAYITLHAYTII